MEYYGQTLDKHKAKSKWGGMLLAQEYTAEISDSGFAIQDRPGRV